MSAIPVDYTALSPKPFSQQQQKSLDQLSQLDQKPFWAVVRKTQASVVVQCGVAVASTRYCLLFAYASHA